jgi:hypothetical protein
VRRYSRSVLVQSLVMLALGLLVMSCSGGSTSSGGNFQSAKGTGYMSIGDAPPAGTSILRFEITLSNATLCPTVGSAGECTGNPQVAMLSAPVRLEMTQLQLGSAFLSVQEASAGSYAGVRLTFSNPRLMLLQPDGTIEELVGVTLPLNPVSVTPKFSSPVTVADKTNFGFHIDFNAQDSIQSSGGVVTGIAPVVTLAPSTFSTQQPVEVFENTRGTLGGLSATCASGTGSFTLTDSNTEILFTSVHFDSTTEFDDGITCDTLVNGQIVEADIELQSTDPQTASFFARRIQLVNEPNASGFEGTILQVNTASEFVLLLHHSEGGTGISSGAIVTVSFDPQNVVFKVAPDGLTVDPALFASGAHLLAGQSVELDVVSVVLGTHSCAEASDNCTATVDEVKLKDSTFTGTVGQAIVNPDFPLVQLPSLFGISLPPPLVRPLSADCQSCLIETLTVRTSAATEYEDLPGGFSGLLNGSMVTVRGLLFKDGFQGPGPSSSGKPLFMAQKVKLVTAPL